MQPNYQNKDHEQKTRKRAIISLVVACSFSILSLLTYLSTARLNTPESGSAGENFVYNLIFFPILFVAVVFAFTSLTSLIVYWRTKRNRFRYLVAFIILLTLGPVIFQVVFIVAKFVYAMASTFILLIVGVLKELLQNL